jgi:hypothetical protein
MPFFQDWDFEKRPKTITFSQHTILGVFSVYIFIFADYNNNNLKNQLYV